VAVAYLGLRVKGDPSRPAWLLGETLLTDPVDARVASHGNVAKTRPMKVPAISVAWVSGK
jgi:hypothetical protein